jgi:lysozyme family protein
MSRDGRSIREYVIKIEGGYTFIGQQPGGYSEIGEVPQQWI